jgi:hypothetical protein
MGDLMAADSCTERFDSALILQPEKCGASSENERCRTDMQINSQKGATK